MDNAGNNKRPRPCGPELLSPGMTREEFLALRSDWYQRLADEGFVDHEVFGNDGDCLPIMRPTPEHNYASLCRRYEATVEYYARCRQFAHSSSFVRHLRPFDRTVWRLHCEGLSRRGVGAELAAKGTLVRIRSGKDVPVTDKLVRDALRRCHAALAAWWKRTAPEREAEQRARAQEDGCSE